MKRQSDKNILIVGAGLAGATIARVLAEKGIKVSVIDRRSHLGGNIFDFENDKNERIHKYGPHLLHCNKNSIALKFLSRFTEWVKYEHKVRALLRDAKILILDEPTASLDKENKQNLFKTISKISKNKTVIIITHDDIDGNYKKINLNKGKIEKSVNNWY